MAAASPASLDPVGISELAAALRDETWLDARLVPGGLAQRVRVLSLTIFRDHEEVSFEQMYESGELMASASFTVNAEEVWWIRPTEIRTARDTPLFRLAGKLKSGDVDYDCAVQAVAEHFEVTASDLRNIVEIGLGTKRERYWVMMVLEDLKGDRAPALQRFGYMSPQPFISARDHMKRHNQERWLARTQRRAQELKAGR